MSFGTSTFVGDPFGDDQNELEAYGMDIREARSIFPFDAESDFPPCKSSNVSFMKCEELPRNLRSLVSVTDAYLAYSVTQKRNILRVIDRNTGEKPILKGHESAILDVKISSVEPSLFCSVDGGDSPTAPHVIVWQRDANTEKLQFSKSATLSLPATAVCAHPVQSSLWAINDKRNIAVFSTLRVTENPPKSYEDLPCHAAVEEGENITDMVFSGTGRHLVCAINGAENNAYVQIFALISSASDTESESDSDVLHGTESLQKVFVDYHTTLRIPSLLAVFATHTGFLVTLSRNEQSLFDEEQLAYELKVWTHDSLSLSLTSQPQIYTPTKSAPQFLQSVLVGLPQHTWRAKMPSSSLLNPSLEAALSSDKNHKFLLVTSRKSAYAAYVALAPLPSAQYPLYHLTLLNLKAPVVAVHTAITLSRDHHSFEDHEHVQMSIYQEEATTDLQASVLQYNSPMAYLAESYAQYLNPPTPRSARFSPSPSPSLGDSKKESSSAKPQSSLLDKLMAAAGVPADSSSATLSVSSLTSAAAPLSARKEVDFSPTITVLNVDQAGLQELRHTHAAAATHAAEPVLPVLKKVDSKSLFASSPATVTPSEPDYVSVSAVPFPARAEEDDDLPDFLKQQQQQQQASGSSKFMSLLRGGNAALSAPPSASVPISVSESLSVAPTPSSVPEPAITPALSVSLSPVVREEAKEKEEKKEKVQEQEKKKEKKEPVVPAVVAETQSLTQTKVAVPAPVLTVPVSVSAAPVLTVPATTAAVVAAAPAPAAVDLSPVLSLLQSMQREMQSMQTAHQRELKAVREELLAQSRAQEKKTTDAVVKAVKTYVDGENKKILEAVSASKAELAQQLNDQLQNKVLPALTQKLRESVQSVRDTVKNTLAESFRTAFESSLLPAFQVGTDRLFAQVNGSFEQVLKTLSEDVLLIHQEHMQSHDGLEQEMQNLREDVQALQENVGEVSTKLTQGAFSLSAKEQVSPMELLKQGKIAEALRAALEAREIDETVALLAELTAQQVNSHCPSIVRLCLAQQLAVEMSQTMPKEGLASRVQWIKNLVMSLVRIAPAEIASDAVLAKNFKVMIQAVLESMQAARALIEKAHFDDGEEQTVDIPHSVEVDLEMLECVIQNKMQTY